MLRMIVTGLLAGLWCVPVSAQVTDEVFTSFITDYPAGYPEWSPDGKCIIFTADFSEEQEGNLFALAVDGLSKRVQLTEGGGHHGVFSPDGKYIAYDAERGSIVRLIPAEGGTPVRIVPASVHIERSANPCWSPDGRRIAFRSDSSVLVLDLPSGEITQAFTSDGLIPMPIQWVPGTEAIIAALINPEDRTANHWRIPLDGGEALQLTFTGRSTQGTISPDGRLLVYSLTPDGVSNHLWAVSAEGGEPLQLTNDEFGYIEPCWSPAGDQLVVRSNRGGWYNLWLMDLDQEEVVAKLAALQVDVLMD